MYTRRIEFLEESHRVLDNHITYLQNSGNFDDQKLSQLKKKKLQLRDEISRLRKLDWEEQHERVEWDDER
jgi:hypothetical protein